MVATLPYMLLFLFVCQCFCWNGGADPQRCLNEKKSRRRMCQELGYCEDKNEDTGRDCPSNSISLAVKPSGNVCYPVAAEKGICPQDFTYDRSTGLCYKMFREARVTFYMALHFCSMLQSRLVILDTQDKLDCFKLEISTKIDASNKMWIGGRRDHTGEFTHWLDGSKINNTLWVQGEPNNRKGIEDCLDLVFFHLNDDRCDLWQSFICELPVKT